MGRLIDADKLGIGKANREVFTVPEYADGWNSAVELIENAPTVDAVEVVRCGKCEELHREWYCGLSGMPVDEDDFCSFGKEKR